MFTQICQFALLHPFVAIVAVGTLWVAYLSGAGRAS
jgi:hypothetical protein